MTRFDQLRITLNERKRKLRQQNRFARLASQTNRAKRTNVFDEVLVRPSFLTRFLTRLRSLTNKKESI